MTLYIYIYITVVDRDLKIKSYLKKKFFDEHKLQNVIYAVLDDDVCCPGTEY